MGKEEIMEDYMDEVIGMIDLTQNKPLNQIIYEGLRSAIIKGVIPMGERINEKSYATALNVSRTPIREALHRIQEEDIVRYVPNFGIMTTQFTKKDVEEIYQIRHALEVLASASAARLMTEEREKQLDELLIETERAEAEDRIDDVVLLSKQFNDTIYEFAEMPRLRSIQNRLSDYLIRFRSISLNCDERRRAAVKEHRDIFECMRRGDIEEMEKIIDIHLQRSKEQIDLQFEQ